MTREEMDKVAEEIDLINRSADDEQAVDLPSDELLHEAAVIREECRLKFLSVVKCGS